MKKISLLLCLVLFGQTANAITVYQAKLLDGDYELSKAIQEGGGEFCPSDLHIKSKIADKKIDIVEVTSNGGAIFNFDIKNSLTHGNTNNPHVHYSSMNYNQLKSKVRRDYSMGPDYTDFTSLKVFSSPYKKTGKIKRFNNEKIIWKKISKPSSIGYKALTTLVTTFTNEESPEMECEYLKISNK